jgi:hypothetical protein
LRPFLLDNIRIIEVEMPLGSVKMYWLFKETGNRLDSFAARVKMGKDLPSALEFGRYVLNSGLCDLLDAHQAKGALPCNGKTMRTKAEKLCSKVLLRFETNDTKPHVDLSDLEEINRKLDDLSAAVVGQSSQVQSPEILHGDSAPEFLKLLEKETSHV